MKVLLAGGGTGGHLFPLLAVVKKLKEQNKTAVDFLYLGPVNNFSKKVLEENGIQTIGIMAAKWRRYNSFLNILDIFKFPVSLAQSLYYVLRYMPDVVFSKGGYGSFAPTLAARIYWIPILIHESDAIPGVANQMMAKMADKVAVSFRVTKKFFNSKKTLLTGNPVRDDIKKGSRVKAREIFGLANDKPVILILGGSQGSKIINNAIAKIADILLRSFQIIHQTGEGNKKEVEKIMGEKGVKAGRSNYHLYEFLDQELINAFAVADLIISRAGSGTIAEIAALNKPAILVPLANSANNHQLHNAYAVTKKSGAIIVKESNLGERNLINQISAIMSDSSLRGYLTKNIGQFYYPDAADKIAIHLLYLASEVDNIEGKGLFEKKR